MSILRIREVLNEKKITSKDLAVKIDMTETSISRMLGGEQYPKLATLIKIAEVLDVDVRELFNATKPDHTQPVYRMDDGVLVEVGRIDPAKF